MEVSDLLNLFTEDSVNLVAHLIAGFVLISLLKHVGESISGFIQIKVGGTVIVGTPVKVYGEEGWIKKITWNKVLIETHDGWLTVPTKEWASSKFLKLKVENHPSQNKGEKDV